MKSIYEKPLKGVGEIMTVEKLAEVVFQGLGEASVCWSERPTGVFDSVNAARIGDEIMQAIKEYCAEQATSVNEVK